MHKINQIQIDVNGLTATGKTHVMNVIKKALKAEYSGAQVCSYDLDIELNGNNESDFQEPLPEATVFWINEGRPADFRKLIGLGEK